MNSEIKRPAPYDKLIDDQVWAFIDDTNACYPADCVNASIAEQRQVYNAMCAQFYRGRPTGTNTRDYRLGESKVAVREYTTDTKHNANTTTVLYFHGGGFVVGDLDSHDDICGGGKSRP